MLNANCSNNIFKQNINEYFTKIFKWKNKAFLLVESLDGSYFSLPVPVSLK